MDWAALIQSGVVATIIMAIGGIITARIAKTDASQTISHAAAEVVTMLRDELKTERLAREALGNKINKLEKYVEVLRALLIINKITPPPIPDDLDDSEENVTKKS